MTTSHERIPILDIRRFDEQTAGDKQAFVDDIGASFRRWGFVGITHHGIPDGVISGAYEVMRKFFALPEDVRRSYFIEGLAGARGYTPFGIEHAKDSDTADLKEFWHVGRELPADMTAMRETYPPNVWPKEIAGFKEATYGLYEALDHLGRRVLKAVSLHLGLAEDFFEDKVNYGNSILRPLHYPPITEKSSGVRAGRHEDINLITLLVGSGEPGLQILNNDNEWVPVDTIPGTIVCNVGDMLQMMTNHVLPSTTHRVVNPPPPYCHESRYSTPYFLHPNSDCLLETLPGCVTPDNPNRYPNAMTAHEYLTQRLIEIGLKS